MLAVTTRNRLHSACFCLPMLRARGLIARQLARAPGLVRYVGGVASPTEFLTLTIWEDKRAMQVFMQSGSHERFMWAFARWTASFWSMRWEPTADEVGAWGGLRLSASSAPSRPVSPLVTAGLLPPNPPRAGPLGPRPESGTVEPRDCGLFAATAIVREWRSLARACSFGPAARAGRDADLIRWTVGVDRPPRALALSVWRDTPAARERAIHLLAEEIGAAWAMSWLPGDYEIGHWDGLHLRLAARRQGAVPAAASNSAPR